MDVRVLPSGAPAMGFANVHGGKRRLVPAPGCVDLDTGNSLGIRPTEARRRIFLRLGWGCFLFPLAVLELYLCTQKRDSATARYLVAALLVTLTLLKTVGIWGAYKVFWGPLL